MPLLYDAASTQVHCAGWTLSSSDALFTQEAVLGICTNLWLSLGITALARQLEKQTRHFIRTPAHRAHPSQESALLERAKHFCLCCSRPVKMSSCSCERLGAGL